MIGLIAQILGLDTEDLTVIVLAHELAHAYTHRAQDIDGKAWDTTGFAKSGHDLKEGLAQYYTAQVCDRLAASAPNVKIAYETLLRFQPPAYHTHNLVSGS